MQGDFRADFRCGSHRGSECDLDGHSLNELRFRVDWGVALASISLRGFRNLEPTIVGFAEGSN